MKEKRNLHANEKLSKQKDIETKQTRIEKLQTQEKKN